MSHVGDNPKAMPRVLLCYLETNNSVLQGIARYVREYGPWSLCRMPAFGLERMPAWLSRWRGDGIIGRTVDAASAEVMRSLDLPFVDLRGGGRLEGVPLVHSDDEAVGRLAAEHLLERGFGHLGFYGPAGEHWARDRARGFERAIREAGATYYEMDGQMQIDGPDTWDQAETAVASWLAPLPKPLAVMGGNDDLAERVLNAARRAGLRVPDELAVIGVNDDAATCEVCDPPLSTVMRDYEHQGYVAAELLHRMMNGEPPPPGPVLIRPVGVNTRQSTDVLAIDDADINAAVSFIRRHACAGIGVDNVLRVVPLSRSVLQRRFRRVLGQTVNDAIIQQRLKRAQELLRETELPLQEVAELAGFQHAQYLGAVFRKRLGTTPARFRKQKAAQPNAAS